MRHLSAAAAAIVLGTLAVESSLQAQDSAGPYVGFSLGNFSYYEEAEELGLEIDDDTDAYRLFGGYQFNDHLAVEAGYGATGDIKETFTAQNVRLDINAEYELISLRVLGIAPLGKVSLIGGVGYYDADLTVGVTASSGTLSASESLEDSENGASLIGAIQLEFDRIGLRGEYEWFDADDSVEAWSVALGLLFRF